MIIYKATNKINGKVYIGQTRTSLELRKVRHLSLAHNGGTTHFCQAIRKYGDDSFQFETICRAYSKEELNRLETFYIQQYDSIRSGYNMVDGGDNNIMDIPEVKSRHKKSMSSESVRSKISSTMKQKIKNGELFTEEHRKHLSEAAMGNHNFGSGDTRSIGCYCIDSNGIEHHFHSYRDAWKWWKDSDNVFDTNSECIFQRKIKQSIETGIYSYKGREFTVPKWFKEVMPHEVTNKS